MTGRVLATVVVLVTALASRAEATSRLALLVEQDGTTYLWNASAAGLAFELYSVTSPANQLDPVGWDSIHEQVLANQAAVIDALGFGALFFHATNSAPPGRLQEQSFFIDRAMLSAGEKFSIGQPFSVLP